MNVFQMRMKRILVDIFYLFALSFSNNHLAMHFNACFKVA